MEKADTPAELPSVSPQQQSGLEAASVFSRWANKHRHLWRPAEQATDFGVDGELELAQSTVSGQLVKIQIKGSRRVQFSPQGCCNAAVRQSTRNYWALMRLPVVAVLVDLDTDAMYWTVPRLPLLDEKPSVSFNRTDSITDDTPRFVQALRHLATHPAQADELDRVPFLVESLEDLDQLSWLDYGTTVGIEADGLLSLFHEHVVRLKVLFGVGGPVVFPHENWVRRSRLLAARFGWDPDDGLLDVVAGELMLYLRALYLPLLDAIRTVAGSDALLHPHPALDRWLRTSGKEIALPPIGRSTAPVTAEALHDVPPAASFDIRVDRIFAAMGIRLVDLEQALEDQT